MVLASIDAAMAAALAQRVMASCTAAECAVFEGWQLLVGVTYGVEFV